MEIKETNESDTKKMEEPNDSKMESTIHKNESTTTLLQSVLEETTIKTLDEALDKNKDKMVDRTSFVNFYYELIDKYDLKQKDIYIKANLSYKVANKLMTSLEKEVTNRDRLIAISYVAGFTLTETNTLLKYAGLQTLYARNKRDAVLIVAFNNNINGRNIFDLNELLNKSGEKELDHSD